MPPATSYIVAPALAYPAREAIKATIQDCCRRGWRVFPVDAAGDRPIDADWLLAATANEREAFALFARYADCNIGIVTGATSNLFGLRFPAAEAEEGREQLEILSAVSSWLVLSPDGSETHLFRHHPGAECDGLRTPAFGSWLGEGSYVVLPPSTTRLGRFLYEETTNSDGRPDPDGPEYAVDALLGRARPLAGRQRLAAVRRLQLFEAAEAVGLASQDEEGGGEDHERLRAALEQLTRVLGGVVCDHLLPRAAVEHFWSVFTDPSEFMGEVMPDGGQIFAEACEYPSPAPVATPELPTSILSADAWPDIRSLGDEMYLRAFAFREEGEIQRSWARPMRLADCAEPPARPRLYGQHLTRGQLSVLSGPGGAGKTAVAMANALSVATGKSLLGVGPIERAKVWFWNGEEPEAEIRARVLALAQLHGLAAAEIDSWLHVGDGRSSDLVLVRQGAAGPEVNETLVVQIVEFVLEQNIGLVVLDPLIATHRVPENDNGAMELVARALIRIASQGNCAVLVVHHTRKLNGHAATVDDGRGANALPNAARWVGMVQGLTAREAADWRIPAAERHLYLKIEPTKANLSPSRTPIWLHMASAALSNGEEVQAIEAWNPPADVPETSEADVLQIQQRIEVGRPQGQGPYRYSSQASDAWGGVPVAEALGLDVTIPADRARVKAMIDALIDGGALQVKVQRHGPKGKEAPFLFVGQGQAELGE